MKAPTLSVRVNYMDKDCVYDAYASAYRVISRLVKKANMQITNIEFHYYFAAKLGVYEMLIEVFGEDND